MSTMRLNKLDAFFVSRTSPLDANMHKHETADGAQGVMFRCPLPSCGHMVLVWFSNPLNAAPAHPELTPLPRWERTGTTIEDLTISPSIHLVTPGGCGWHGWVKDGDAG